MAPVCTFVLYTAGLCVLPTNSQTASISDLSDCDRPTGPGNRLYCEGVASAASGSHNIGSCSPVYSDGSAVHEVRHGACNSTRSVRKAMNVVWWVNLFSFILSIFFVVAPWTARLKEDEASCTVAIASSILLGLGVVLLITGVLQLVAFGYAVDIDNNARLKDMSDAGCFNFEGTTIIADMDSGFKAVRFLAVVEVCLDLAGVAIILKAYGTDKPDSVDTGLEILVALSSILLSAFGFFVFSLDLTNKGDALFESLTTGVSKDPFKALPCVFYQASGSMNSQPLSWITLAVVVAVVLSK